MKKLINFLALLLVLIVAIPATMSAQESDKNVTCSGVVVDFNVEPGDPALEALDGLMINAREVAAVTESTPSFNGYNIYTITASPVSRSSRL